MKLIVMTSEPKKTFLKEFTVKTHSCVWTTDDNQTYCKVCYKDADEFYFCESCNKQYCYICTDNFEKKNYCKFRDRYNEICEQYDDCPQVEICPNCNEIFDSHGNDEHFR